MPTQELKRRTFPFNWSQHQRQEMPLISLEWICRRIDLGRWQCLFLWNLWKEGKNSQKIMHQKVTKHLDHRFEALWIQLWLNAKDKDQQLSQVSWNTKHAEVYCWLPCWRQLRQRRRLHLCPSRNSYSLRHIVRWALLFFRKAYRQMVQF